MKGTPIPAFRIITDVIANSCPSYPQTAMPKENPQFERFTEAMRKLVAVPHSEIKAHLDSEKEAKKLKRTRKSKYAAFRAVNKNG